MTAVIPLAAIWVINPKQRNKVLKIGIVTTFNPKHATLMFRIEMAKKSLEIGGCFAVSDETPEKGQESKMPSEDCHDDALETGIL